ncbi:uncharacterized protein LOC114838526 isoform X2 [Esox lucius]|nr:uncharacterized protein LOC114838526 isoform X2 [Esox lucius]
MIHWNCSQQQKVWMKMELEAMGLWPGSPPVRHLTNSVSLWRLPPQPELIETACGLPSPKYFQLHPFFIWKPENDSIMGRLRNNYVLPCLHSCSRPQITSSGVGRPRVVVGIVNQYYLFASRLCCKACKRNWFADNPLWLAKLPKRYTNMLPALLTYKKAICKSVVDELRRTAKSPNDMANQLMEMMHLKYERANLAYLLSVQNIKDAEAGLYGQSTISKYLRRDSTPAAFGGYEDTDGWCGMSVSSYYLTDCLLQEFQRQEPSITQLLQGTFGQVLRSDHTRKIARKVTLTSGTMSSYAVMNENWMIISWVMVQSESERSLEPMYEGLATRYTAAGIEKANYHWVDRDCCAAFRVQNSHPAEHLLREAWRTTEATVAEVTSGDLTNICASRSKFNEFISVKLDLFHCMRRFCRECVSEHHSLYSSFCQFLSAAFTIVDQQDLKRLKEAYVFCGIVPANPTKQHIREHCRTKIPQPRELVKRVEEVLLHFHLLKDVNDIPLFKPSMLKAWRIQRVHMLRGCLSDPEREDGILYRYGGTLQLNHVQGEGASVPVWIPIRGTSQQEGYHFHQAQWVTGNKVSPELFQAQGMTGVARWNFQRLVDLKQPGVVLPAVFDPLLITDLNMASVNVTGSAKYPALQVSNRDTGERFGLEYVEQGCRAVPLDWEKHRSQKRTDMSVFLTPLPVEKCQPSATQLPPTVRFPDSAAPATEALKRESTEEPQMDIDLPCTPPLPMTASPRSARTGPIKTGGRVFVLDHNRWPGPMRVAIDGLLARHHGQKDMLKLVDFDYASMVQSSCADPNSLLHPTTKHHIGRYIKHLAKLKNTSSSLNTSPEKLLETQQLWQHLTMGSDTTCVPVTALPPAVVNPPALPTQNAPLTEAAIEKIVLGLMEKQQQSEQQQQQKKKMTKTCLSCGQPKSRYMNDGSSIHYFYQSGHVRYFYCSTKVFKTYGAEGLTNPKMSFEDFMSTPFFQQELESIKQKVEQQKDKQKRRSADVVPSGRLCRFCHLEIKQGPNSPHIHTGFPGVAGKYIYCPAKVFSLYQAKGMEKEMTWKEFQASAFYQDEKKRWMDEKRKC